MNANSKIVQAYINALLADAAYALGAEAQGDLTGTTKDRLTSYLDEPMPAPRVWYCKAANDRINPCMEGRRMKALLALGRQITKLGLILMAGLTANAQAGLFGLGGTSWKEEVLLHDGSKIIVGRTIERGGRHEIGQQPPVKEESLNFRFPTTGESVTWKSEYSQDIGIADFMPLLLDIHQGTAYVVSVPVGCLSYNKSGRPNPPYVTFKYEAKAWKRIPVQELPDAIKTPNLVVSSPDNKVEQLGRDFVTTEDVRKINSSLTQAEYKAILREALPNARCPQYSSGPKPPIPIAPSSSRK